jgi:type II secretory pathway component PulM
MTSNATRLRELAAPLQAAGLDDLNISIDARDPELFQQLTRGPIEPVLDGIAAAREAGLGTSLRDQSPDGNNGLRLRIEGASFDTLVTWLASLQQQHGVSIEAASIDAAAPGLVNATLSLKQAGAAG